MNDDKILQIIQKIILGIMKESAKFRYEPHQTPEWRENIENSFKQICQEILMDRNRFFSENLNPNIKGEQQLLELDKVGADSYWNLLRIQNKINIKQFSMTLRD